MAEVAQRSSATRGRGSTRGGRGGHSSRGGRAGASRHTNGDASLPSEPSLDEQGELGQLKKQYLTEINTLKELFPDWTDDDLVFAIQESNGDLSNTIDRITEGNVSQFSDVKKKTREKSRPKVAEATSQDNKPAAAPTGARGTRGRGGLGTEAGRGGRGRANERGRGASRGGRGASRAASAAVVGGSVDADAKADLFGDDKPATPELPADGAWSKTVTNEIQSAGTAEALKSSIAAPVAAAVPPPKKTWASMLSQPKAPPAALPKPKATAPAATAAPVPPVSAQPESVPTTIVVPEPDISTEPIVTGNVAVSSLPTADTLAPSGPARIPSEVSADLAPPKDKLTEDNVELLPDSSIPPGTETVASTRDQASIVGSTTPSMSTPAQATPSSTKPAPIGGYATTAWKAAGMPGGRSASFQRRMLDQQESVVLPGNHAVDRAAVQFGSLGLGNGNDQKPLDVDDDREEPETRAQPPQQSPVAPRASLPPSTPQIPSGLEVTEPIHTPKPAPGLSQPSAPPGVGPIPQGTQQPHATSSQAGGYGQYGRYGMGAQDPSSQQSKAYDPFGQQVGGYASSQTDQPSAYAAQGSSTSGLPQPSQSHLGGIVSGAQTDFGADATRSQQSYYGSSYTQQGAPGLQDQSGAPQRTASGFGASDSGYVSNQHAQSRFSDSHNSGNNTPNPTSHATSQTSQQPQQSQHQPHHMASQHHSQQGGGWGGYNQYPYNYNSPQYGQYMNQYGGAYGGYGQQYGGAPYGGGKGYGQQQHHSGYGMPPQHNTYDQHSSSPANAAGYGSNLRGSDSGFAANLGGDYNRSGSAQAGQATSTSGLGSVNDSYGRSSSGLGHQSQGYGQQSTTSAEDPMKSFGGDSKTGPSPSLGQPGRTGSSIGTSSQYGSQSGFPPPQSQGFPSHLNQYSTSSYGLGGIGGHQGSNQQHQGHQGHQGHQSHQGHQNSGFSGGYGGFGNSYGSGYGARGWGSGYGGSGGYSHQ